MYKEGKKNNMSFAIHISLYMYRKLFLVLPLQKSVCHIGDGCFAPFVRNPNNPDNICYPRQNDGAWSINGKERIDIST